jgi:hypothetical protein
LDPLFQFEKRLEKIVSENKVGEYDGHEIATDYSDGFLYLYGPMPRLYFMLLNLS